jgi:4-amino-4-deoxy-L-arabinose transferase-like glycosyltransferase
MSQAPDATAATAASPDAAPRQGLIGWIARRPDAAFGAFLALHFAVWTALPSLLYANLPLDLIEALTYGREWVLGSDKLPPLPWWLVEIMYRLFGVDAAYYALAEIVVIAAFALVYATARPLVGPARALVAVLIIDGLHYFQYTAVKFNHDVIQLPFWALAGFAFVAALKRGGAARWLLLGIAFGGALWAKYFVVVLAAPYLLFVLFDRDARPALRTPGPWLAIALALVIASPHVVWLFDNHFAPFAYVDARSAPASHWWDYIWHPAFFAAGQFFFMLPALAIAAMFVWPRPTENASPSPLRAEFSADAFDRRIVTLLAFGPAAAMLALIAVSGRGAITMWGYPLWLFGGLWIVLFVPRPLELARLSRVIVAWSAVFTALALVFIADYTVLPLIDHRYRAAFFPGDALAATLTPRFHAATGDKKLRYVVGSMWLAGNLAHYSPDQPHVLIDGLPRRSPWIDLADMRRNGALLVWDVGDLQKLPAPFAALAPDAKVGAPFTLPARRFGNTLEHIGWAILPPQQAKP